MATYSGEFMFIKKIILTSMLILSSGWAHSQSFDLGIQPQFWALDSQEYTLDFDSKVELKSIFTPSDEKIKSQANRQVEFLFGAFDNNHRQGVPKVNHNIEITSVKNDSSNLYVISYHYKGTVQVSGTGANYQFYLPTNPDNVYLKSIVVKSGVTQYPCGDSQHYQSQYFWYFFNPKAYGCPLKENVDYFAVTGTLSHLPSTTETFPEYERMLDAEGNLKVSVFYGLNAYGDTNPKTSTDINATSVHTTAINIATTIGGEYFLGKKFSLGIEAQLNYYNEGNPKIEPAALSPSTSNTTALYTSTFITARLYF
jgi:hypothetical protein